MAKKKEYRGNLDAYNLQIKRLEKGGYDFFVEYNGQMRTIIYLDEKGIEQSRSVYYGRRVGDKFEGAHIVLEVKRPLLKRIISGEKPPFFKSESSVISFNRKAIHNCIEQNEGNCLAFDINSCYWVTAKLVGVITEDLFCKYMKERAKWKKGMVASIGALNKKTATLEYRNGKVKTHFMNSEHGMTRPYYWAIINRVSYLMNEVASKLGDSFYMWLTDCMYIREEKAEEAIEIITSWGYEVKSMEATLLKITENTVHFKNEKKSLPTYVNYSKRQDVGSEFFTLFK
jgi:hypothetical protein